MKKGILLFVLSLTLSIFVNATDVEKTTVPPATIMCINGVIADIDTDETLAGVMVKIEGTDYQTLTDLDGKFKFEGIEAGEYNLELTYISYKEIKVENVNAKGQNKTLDLKLKSE